MKKLFIITFILFLTSCDYTPIHNKSNIQNLNIEVVEMTGDMSFNNLLKKDLEKSSSKESKKKYLISINTSFKKKDFAKDATGKISNFELNLISLFDVEFNGIKKSFTIEEKFFTNSLADKFEQKRYESTIKKNFVTSIKEKLIVKLITLNDN